MTVENLLDTAIDKAATTKFDADYQKVFSLLEGQEVFFNTTDRDADGTPTHVPLTSVGNDLRAVVFFISRSDYRLSKPFGGIPWKKALEMVAKMAAADGLLVQNLSDAWIAVKKEKVEELLRAYE